MSIWCIEPRRRPTEAASVCVMRAVRKLPMSSCFGRVDAEIQAVESARGFAKGATAYLNLKPHVTEAVSTLCEAGVARIVVGLRNPVRDAKGKAIEALRSAGKRVDIWGDADISGIEAKEAAKACREVNAPFLYRSALGIPFSVLKYTMTLDGKIAASSGHSAWVSGPVSRDVGVLSAIALGL